VEEEVPQAAAKNRMQSVRFMVALFCTRRASAFRA
jgi:hypothetical protein